MSDGKNVVVFGESGSGKSSTVNLLLGRQAAAVSDRAVGCTFEFQKYPSESYNLFDTVGLSEGARGTISQKFAVKQLINLLKSLEGGVSLLVFVMEKGKIKKSLDENYKLFVEAICLEKVPVVLMVTHCEMEIDPGKWWIENKQYFDNYGMTFKAVITGCSMDPNTAPAAMRPMIQSLNESTVLQLNAAIKANMLVPGWKVEGGWKSWFQTILGTILKIFCLFFGIPPSKIDSLFGFPSGEPSFQTRLYRYFLQAGYSEELSMKMADDIANAVSANDGVTACKLQ